MADRETDFHSSITKGLGSKTESINLYLSRYSKRILITRSINASYLWYLDHRGDFRWSIEFSDSEEEVESVNESSELLLSRSASTAAIAFFCRQWCAMWLSFWQRKHLPSTF